MIRAIMRRIAWREVAQFCVDVARRFSDDRCTQAAGSLTYTTLLALVPLLTVALTLATAFPVFDRFVERMQSFVLANLLPEAAGIEILTEQLQSFTARAGELQALGLALLAVTAVMMMLTLDDVLNRVFRAASLRPLAQRIAVYISVLIAGPVLIGASLSMTSFLVAGSLGALDLDGLAEAILRLLPFAFTIAALTLLYAVVPNRKVVFRHALAGGVFAGIVFEIAKRGFAIYITKFPTYTLVYGTFATAFVFLLWLYILWLIVLVGATLSAMLPGLTGESDSLKEKL